ncbi:MAG: glycosyltransferase [Endomicrobium sp.]|jgi:glycosyltransferase involved in cell wall biosynthesis/adenine/guanine phosphoribosyltransferase-like PRPP-binding protein|nr:glycosyltransferase [Endomicrobium sp.]
MLNISVIIPVYNAQKYLRQCLDSIINQPLKSIEIICVNDGSTDDSLAILDEYTANDSRIIVINQSNQGAGIARNKGLEIAKGEYIHFVDADDYLVENVYESLYGVAKQNELDFIKCKAYAINEQTQAKLKNSYYELNNIPEDLRNKIIDFFQNPEFLAKTPVSPWLGFVKNEFLIVNNIRFNNLVCVNDRSFAVHALIAAKKMMLVNDYIVYHRRNIEGSLVNIRDQHFNCHFDSYKIIKKIIKTLQNDLQDIFLRVQLRDINGWYYHFKSNNSVYINQMEKSLKKFLAGIDKKLIPKELWALKPQRLSTRFFEAIFSIKNEKTHKVVSLLGLKIKIKSKSKQMMVLLKQNSDRLHFIEDKLLGDIKEVKDTISGRDKKFEELSAGIKNAEIVLKGQDKKFEELSAGIKDAKEVVKGQDKKFEELDKKSAKLETKVDAVKQALLWQKNKIVFKCFQDMADTISANIYKLPNDIDLVVGIPRSGIIPAYIIAGYLNRKVCSFNEFINDYSINKGKRPILGKNNSKEIKKVLIVDDSIHSGKAMLRAQEVLKTRWMNAQYKLEYLAVYGRKGSNELVDYCFEIINERRLFQWNYLNHTFASQSCYDLDGLLCIDPTEEQNDDGEKYIKFILNAKPLHIPAYEIHSIVTSRLEKYRSQTVKWLQKHHVQYKNLFMMNLATAEERRALGNHADFKAEIYKSLKDTILFIESNPKQAKKIADLSGKQ